MLSTRAVTKNNLSLSHGRHFELKRAGDKWNQRDGKGARGREKEEREEETEQIFK